MTLWSWLALLLVVGSGLGLILAGIVYAVREWRWRQYHKRRAALTRRAMERYQTWKDGRR